MIHSKTQLSAQAAAKYLANQSPSDLEAGMLDLIKAMCKGIYIGDDLAVVADADEPVIRDVVRPTSCHLRVMIKYTRTLIIQRGAHRIDMAYAAMLGGVY